jgi:hypothetical protein
MPGHEEQWVDIESNEDLLCPVCCLVPRNAVAHSCGQLFCLECWGEWTAKNNGCAICRLPGDATASFRDRRHILNLKIFCPLYCEVSFRLGNKTDHLKDLCSNRCIECSLCKKQTTPAMKEQHDKEECSERIIKCALCNNQMTSAAKEKHDKEECFRQCCFDNDFIAPLSSSADKHMHDTNAKNEYDLNALLRQVIEQKKEIEKTRTIVLTLQSQHMADTVILTLLQEKITKLEQKNSDEDVHNNVEIHVGHEVNKKHKKRMQEFEQRLLISGDGLCAMRYDVKEIQEKLDWLQCYFNDRLKEIPTLTANQLDEFEAMSMIFRQVYREIYQDNFGGQYLCGMLPLPSKTWVYGVFAKLKGVVQYVKNRQNEDRPAKQKAQEISLQETKDFIKKFCSS